MKSEAELKRTHNKLAGILGGGMGVRLKKGDTDMARTIMLTLDWLLETGDANAVERELDVLYAKAHEKGYRYVEP